MLLNLLGAVRDINDVALDPVPSPVTGRPLRRHEIDFEVRRTRQDEVDQELAAAAVGGSAPLVADDGSRWTAHVDQTSWQDGTERMTFRVTIAEVDEAEVSDITIFGHRYELEASHPIDTTWERWAMKFKFVAKGEAAAALEDAWREINNGDTWTGETYFPVELGGIGDVAPKQVRFGRFVWEQLEADERRYVVALVEQSDDPDDDDKMPGVFGLIGQPHLNNTVDFAIKARAEIGALVDLLVDAGHLDRAEVDAALEQAAKSADRFPTRQTRRPGWFFDD